MSWLQEFAAGYVEAAQWSTTARGACTCRGEELGRYECMKTCATSIDVPLDTVELADGQLAAMTARLLAWHAGFAPLLDRAAELRAGYSYDKWSGWELLGHDVWLSQVGHGTGAWDRPSLDVPVGVPGYLGKVGDLVSDAAKLLGESAYGYIGDDGLAYFDGFAS